jgi:hypothetical protein
MSTEVYPRSLVRFAKVRRRVFVATHAYFVAFGAAVAAGVALAVTDLIGVVGIDVNRVVGFLAVFPRCDPQRLPAGS